MTSSEATRTEASSPETPRQRLVAWPLSLIGLTIGLLLITNLVAACGGHRGHHEIGDVKEHAEEAVDHMMHRLDATDDQTLEVQAIVASAIDELAAAHGPKRDWRSEVSALLTADSVDREALETMRTRTVERTNAMSEIATNRFADVLEVLTPEQRAELDERFSKHHRRWR